MNMRGITRRSIAPALAAMLVAALPATAATITWDKGDGDLDWGNAINWGGDLLPGSADVAKFVAGNLADGDIIDANGDRSVQHIQFGDNNAANNPPDVIIANSLGGRITLTGGTATNYPDNLGIVRGSTVTGRLTITSDLVLAPSAGGVTALVIRSQGGSGDTQGIYISGVISDNDAGIGLTKTDGRVLQLSGASTYSGITTVRRSNLLIAADAPAGAPGALGNATSAVQLGDSGTSAAQNVAILTTGAFTVGRDIDVNATPSTGSATIGGQGGVTAGSVFSGRINLFRDLIVQSDASGGQFIDFTGAITGAFGITKTNAGAIRLSNPANDYAGDTTIRNGTVLLATDVPTVGPSALGSAATPVILGNEQSSATATIALLSTGSFTNARDLLVNATPSSGPVTIGADASQAGSSWFTGAITLNRDVHLQSDLDGTDTVDFSGPISGTGGITKIGAGIVRLVSAAGNDYAGPTTVAGGTLLIDTVNSGTGAYLVQAGGTLGGAGSIGGVLTVEEGGTLAPGASIESLGVAGDIALNGRLAIELDGAGVGSADLLHAAGGLILGPTASLDLTSLSPLDDSAYVLAHYGWLSGVFEPANIFGLPAGYQIDYAYDGTSIAVTAVAVPEPAAGLSLLGLGSMLLIGQRRLNRHR